MTTTIQAVRGMRDILPQQTPIWHYLESKIRTLLASYCYEEIRLPLIESTALFNRGIGTATDIIEKEMYTFADRRGESLSLRPEATAGCVRACIEAGLLYNQVQKIWTIGPMFRYERPQKGRYRQFHQVSVEAYGMRGVNIDAELIILSAELWRRLDLQNYTTLEINTIGTQLARMQYRQALTDYLIRYEKELDADSQRRLHTNPLRILDTKNITTRKILDEAPLLYDYLEKSSLAHFENLCLHLTDANIDYQHNKTLVRGLDYYSENVFEWVTDHLGAQSTICAGGRYDTLIALLGGKPSYATGFALGLERIILMLEKLKVLPNDLHHNIDIILIASDSDSRLMYFAQKIRQQCPQLRLLTDCSESNFKTKLRRANRSHSKFIFIVGEKEYQTDSIRIQSCCTDLSETRIPFSQLHHFLQSKI